MDRKHILTENSDIHTLNRESETWNSNNELHTHFFHCTQDFILEKNFKENPDSQLSQ